MEVTRGTVRDLDAVMQLIKTCDEVTSPPRARNISKNEWIKNGFSSNKTFDMLVVRDDQAITNSGILGIATFFYLFSTWEGWFMFIDDLLALPGHKDCGGIKQLLLKECAKIAVEEGCSRVQLEVDSSCTEQFSRLGGAVLHEWVTVRLPRPHLTDLVGRKNMEVHQKFNIRLATADDVPSIYYLVQCLAEDEEEPDAVKIPIRVFEEGLIGKTAKSYKCFLVETENLIDVANGDSVNLPSSKLPRDKHIVGMALYLTMFCKREGRILHLEDLFVLPQYRNQGVGTELMRLCGQDGLIDECSQMDWQVLKWKSRTVNLYKKLNGDFLNEYSLVRFSGDGITDLAEARIELKK